MRMVLIRWRDSSSRAGWTMKEEYKPWVMEDLECETIGFVQEETDDLICVVQNLSVPQIGEQMTIPKFAVTKIIELGESTKRR